MDYKEMTLENHITTLNVVILAPAISCLQFTWATDHSPRRAALKIKGLPRPLTSREAGRGERVLTVMEKAAKTPS
jgi:hypothetical protein